MPNVRPHDLQRNLPDLAIRALLESAHGGTGYGDAAALAMARRSLRHVGCLFRTWPAAAINRNAAG